MGLAMIGPAFTQIVVDVRYVNPFAAETLAESVQQTMTKMAAPS